MLTQKIITVITKKVNIQSQLFTRDTRLSIIITYYTAPCNGVVSHGASIWGSSGFCRRHTRRAAGILTRGCLHAQTAAHAGNQRTWRTTIILIKEKPRRPPNWTPCRDQDGAASGISIVYLCIQYIKTNNVCLTLKFYSTAILMTSCDIYRKWETFQTNVKPFLTKPCSCPFIGLRNWWC